MLPVERVGAAKSFARAVIRRTFGVLLSSPAGRTHWRPTAERCTTLYLDGIRGYATMAVVLYNFSRAINSKWDFGFGFGLPVLCVISGYVISYKPLLRIRTECWESLLSTMASYTFRRFLRIYLPAMAASFLSLIMLRLGLYEFARTTTFEHPEVQRFPTWNNQWWDWVKETVAMTNPLGNWAPKPTVYITAMWTLPLLFRNSMVLFITMIGLSRVREAPRLLALTVLAASACRKDQLEMMSVFGGIMIAELDLRRLWNERDPKEKRSSSVNVEMWIGPLNWVGFVLSILLLLQPSKPLASSSDRSIFQLLDLGVNPRFWQHAGAFLMILTTGRLARIQSLFTSTTAQYLGQMSFPIYLFHGPVLQIVGYRIMNIFLGKAGQLRSGCLALSLGLCLAIPLLLSVAHIFERYVDAPLVELLKSVESMFAEHDRAYAILPATSGDAERLRTREETRLSKSPMVINEEAYPETISAPSFLNKLLSALKHTGWFLLPSFVKNWLCPSSGQPKVHSTAWLDGLRGVAALVVFFNHLINPWHKSHLTPFGFDDKNLHLMQLPIINLVYSGHTMVYIFFVISGYVLSSKPLRQIRQGRSEEKLLQSLSSSIFRRATRLFFPVLASTFITMVLIQLGIFELTRAISRDPAFLPGYPEPHTKRWPSFYGQFLDWANRSEAMVFTWETYGNPYDYHTWTINVEYRCSMVVFLFLLAFSKLTSRFRLASLCLFILCLWYLGAWHENMFLLGVLIAEINQIQAGYATSAAPKSAQSGARQSHVFTQNLWRIFGWMTFGASLYLASYPKLQPWNTPGFITLSRIIWARHFWSQAGSALLVFSISNSPDVQKIFNNPVARYLGNISFALYLIHYAVIHTIGYMVILYVQKMFGTDTLFKFEVGFILGGIVVTASAFWIADVFWRAIDLPSVKFARWTEDMWLIPSQK